MVKKMPHELFLAKKAAWNQYLSDGTPETLAEYFKAKAAHEKVRRRDKPATRQS